MNKPLIILILLVVFVVAIFGAYMLGKNSNVSVSLSESDAAMRSRQGDSQTNDTVGMGNSTGVNIVSPLKNAFVTLPLTVIGTFTKSSLKQWPKIGSSYGMIYLYSNEGRLLNSSGAPILLVNENSRSNLYQFTATIRDIEVAQNINDSGYLIFMDNNGITKIRHEIRFMRGDINSDGLVDIGDSLLIMQYINNLRSFTNWQLAIGDINNDGMTTSNDALAIHYYEFGNPLVTNFIVGDVNYDGNVDSTDLTKLNDHIDGTPLFDYRGRIAGDVTNDSYIEMLDATTLSSYIDGSLPEIPINQR